MINGLEILAQTVVTGNLILIQGLGLYALTRYTKDVKEASKAGVGTLVSMLLAGALVWFLQPIQPASPSALVGYYLVIGLIAAYSGQRLLGETVAPQDTLFESSLVGLLLLLGSQTLTGPGILLYAFGGGLGYTLVLIVMATIRERLELAPVPRPLQGVPILLITAGLLAIALLGFRL